MTHTSTEQPEPRYADVVHHANVHPSLSYVARKTGLCYQETTRLLELALERGGLASGDYAGRNLGLYVADREKALTQEVEQLRARVQELEAAQARVPLSDELPQFFLSDVLTAAGLVSHGKQCKALGSRIGEAVEAIWKISIKQREAIAANGTTQEKQG